MHQNGKVFQYSTAYAVCICEYGGVWSHTQHAVQYRMLRLQKLD